MRQVHRKGLATVMLTGGALAMATGYAHADASADGSAVGSPGVLAGNGVQLPVHLPVNACGNTVNVVGLLNPAAGNSCANTSAGGGADDTRSGGSAAGGTRAGGAEADGADRDGAQTGGAGAASGAGASNGGGARAEGQAAGSPGLLSGNGIALPVDLPANVSGNSVNVVGIGNPVMGNTSVNVSEQPPTETEPTTPPVVEELPDPEPVVEEPVRTPAPAPAAPSVDALAHTGADTAAYALSAGAAMLLGGALLYRRSRGGSSA
ncbi:chaplin [Streptomyces sp. C10-9-1]|uniref:chaplin n=1 Tax=Streptomyces sp. C10-9-1 TaxID=1859285 RepID=UPI00273A5AFA|nr:chaplin [Streptomyces sp. C10-9-1]